MSSLESYVESARRTAIQSAANLQSRINEKAEMIRKALVPYHQRMYNGRTFWAQEKPMRVLQAQDILKCTSGVGYSKSDHGAEFHVLLTGTQALLDDLHKGYTYLGDFKYSFTHIVTLRIQAFRPDVIEIWPNGEEDKKFSVAAVPDMFFPVLAPYLAAEGVR